MRGPGANPWPLKGETIMKKQTKKLVLSKETLSRLEENLNQVAGGSHYPDCPWSGGYRTCATCGNTCTTNLC